MRPETLFWIEYLVMAIGLAIVAYKSGHPLYWLAFIPLAQVWLILDIVDLPLWVIIPANFPFVGMFVQMWIWVKMASDMDAPWWYGILLMIPGANIWAALKMVSYRSLPKPDLLRP